MDQLPKLRWRARRGMREMDRLFDHYLDHHYADAPAEEKAMFSALLEMQDPELFDLLLLKAPPQSPEQEALIKKINPHLS
ncbi:succinate dehydrogenase assembly factor 2 [Wohlfahrtiimonas chitiniclastica]|uniref:FAD assembly factor SdhE n=1 Tax=Wohlfahrtiimonas chitiniclastica TaxID=400946 RepID=UPI0007B3FE6F|nr:succinate dehydrogenase assembly factor 2 [Wohlfahrtiimonas chitiniclastica]WHR55163.1 succinate dehydrogenase assembly factor 2 [Wohlfahrtiimonas chitiniclastica]